MAQPGARAGRTARGSHPTPDEVHFYQGDQCHALAATIVRLRPGWRMVAVTDRHVAAQAPDGRCFDLYGWAEWDHVREVDLQELDRLGFVAPIFDERVDDVARRLLAANDPLDEEARNYPMERSDGSRST